MERNHDPFYEINNPDITDINYDELSREDYRTFKSFNIDKNIVNKCLNEIQKCHCNSDRDRTNLYLKSVINRIRNLDDELNKFHKNYLGDDCSIYDLSKIIKLSARLSADIFDNYMNILVDLCS